METQTDIDDYDEGLWKYWAESSRRLERSQTSQAGRQSWTPGMAKRPKARTTSRIKKKKLVGHSGGVKPTNYGDKSEDVRTTRRMLEDFMEAHSDGMAALQQKDFRRFGDAVDRELDLIAEQRLMIKQQQRDIDRLIRESARMLSEKSPATRKRPKKR